MMYSIIRWTAIYGIACLPLAVAHRDEDASEAATIITDQDVTEKASMQIDHEAMEKASMQNDQEGAFRSADLEGASRIADLEARAQALVGTVLDGSFLLKQAFPEDYFQNPKKLGGGAFGTVFKAEALTDMTYEGGEQIEAGKAYAVKALFQSDSVTDDYEVAQDESRGCQLIQGLRAKADAMKEDKSLIMGCLGEHVNCFSMTDKGKPKRARSKCDMYLVYELAPGHDLDKFIQYGSGSHWRNPDTKSLLSAAQSVNHKVEVMKQLIAAVRIMSKDMGQSYLRVSHQDLKPQNIKVDISSGTAVVRIMDFGLAQAFDDRFKHFTYAWSPPEAFFAGQNTRECTGSTSGYAYGTFDMWSIGAIYYYMDTLSYSELDDYKCHKFASSFQKIVGTFRGCENTKFKTGMKVSNWKTKHSPFLVGEGLRTNHEPLLHHFASECLKDACHRPAPELPEGYD